MAEQARSIEYRLKRYRGSLRSPMRENRTTVGQLPVFSLHFCSIVSLTVSLFSSFLFSPPPLSLSLSVWLSVFQRGIGSSSLCTSIVGTTRARKLHGFPFLRRGERLPASLVISCRLAIARFRSLSPGSLGVISGELFYGSS